MTTVFGKYKAYDTIVHRLDSRVKIFGLLAFMVMCFLPYGNYANRFIILSVMFLTIIILMALSKISFFDFLKSLKSLWFMMIFLIIIFVFVQNSSTIEARHVMIRFSDSYAIYWEGLLQTLHIFVRFSFMIALTLIFTATTSPMDITYAIEWYLTPLRLIKFPTQIMTMIFSLALRFIPTLMTETQKIMNAQRSRGVDYNRGFISKKIRSVSTLIVPLLVSCFSRSIDLSLAMDARGYDPYGKRSSYKVLKFSLIDLFGIIFILFIMGFFITMCVLSEHIEGFDNLLNLLFGIEAF